MKKKILTIMMIMLFSSLLFAQGVLVAQVEGNETTELNLTPGIYKIVIKGSVNQTLPPVQDPFWYCYANLSPFSTKISNYMTGGWIGTHSVGWTTTYYRIESTGTYIFGGAVVPNYGCTLNWSTAKLIRVQPLSEM